MQYGWKTGDIAALELIANDGGSLCTLMRVDGSFSREVGCHLAIAGSGKIAGSLADGCLEAELANQSLQAAIERCSRLVRYGKGSPFIDFRLPCGAGIDVLVDPLPDRRQVQSVLAALTRRQSASMSFDDRTSRVQRSYIPPLRLLIFGSGPEAYALAAIAEAHGALVELRTPELGLSLGRPPRLDAEADPWSAVVLLFHDHEWEHSILRWALDSPAFFIGAIGGGASRVTRQKLLESDGIDKFQLNRIKGPIGLIPSTREPSILAISILAQVVNDYVDGSKGAVVRSELSVSTI